jgi:ribonuclease HIII
MKLDYRETRSLILQYFDDHELEIETEKEIPYGTQISILGGSLKLNLYNGKKGATFTIQSKDKDAKAAMEQEIQLLLFKGVSSERDDLKRIYPGLFSGQDETGKGDFFGPLVCCGVVLDENTAEKLAAEGLQDSKTLSDKKIVKLAESIRKVTPGRCRVFSLKPEKYNELYANFSAQGRNLNHLLSWMHGTVMKELFGKVSGLKTVVIDKFASERHLQWYFQDFESQAKLIQVTKAEYNVAVAAASVMARAALVSWHEETAQELGFELPKGAGSHCSSMAERLVSIHGEENLKKWCKLHFKCNPLLPTE